jgi:hypothetical protein
LRKSRVAAAITVALMCVVCASILAQVSSRKKDKGAWGDVSVANFAPASPSKEYVYAGGRLIATEEPDTQPPVFPNGCPATMNVAAAYSCPYATNTQVNYANPQATDNNPGVTVSCSPPSGSSFSVGTTTVTCTATDAAGNTATCSFNVDVFSACLADNSNAGSVVLFNASTGEFRFCCGGVPAASGLGTLTVHGCDVTIDNIKGNRTVHISASGGTGTGSATIKINGVVTCQITDSAMAGDVCTCP